jgi:energy-coupling factor transporter ATP-binding protein EcfA2
MAAAPIADPREFEAALLAVAKPSMPVARLHRMHLALHALAAGHDGVRRGDVAVGDNLIAELLGQIDNVLRIAQASERRVTAAAANDPTSQAFRHLSSQLQVGCVKHRLLSLTPVAAPAAPAPAADDDHEPPEADVDAHAAKKDAEQRLCNDDNGEPWDFSKFSTIPELAAGIAAMAQHLQTHLAPLNMAAITTAVQAARETADDVTNRVRALTGSKVVFLGATGSGKSTTINLLLMVTAMSDAEYKALNARPHVDDPIERWIDKVVHDQGFDEAMGDALSAGAERIRVPEVPEQEALHKYARERDALKRVQAAAVTVGQADRLYRQGYSFLLPTANRPLKSTTAHPIFVGHGDVYGAVIVRHTLESLVDELNSASDKLQAYATDGNRQEEVWQRLRDGLLKRSDRRADDDDDDNPIEGPGLVFEDVDTIEDYLRKSVVITTALVRLTEAAKQVVNKPLVALIGNGVDTLVDRVHVRDGLIEYCRERPVDRILVRAAYVFAPSHLLEGGMTLVDCPGVGDGDRHKVHHTQTIIADARAAVVLTGKDLVTDGPTHDFVRAYLVPRLLREASQPEPPPAPFKLLLLSAVERDLMLPVSLRSATQLSADAGPGPASPPRPSGGAAAATDTDTDTLVPGESEAKDRMAAWELLNTQTVQTLLQAAARSARAGRAVLANKMTQNIVIKAWLPQFWASLQCNPHYLLQDSEAVLHGLTMSAGQQVVAELTRLCRQASENELAPLVDVLVRPLSAANGLDTAARATTHMDGALGQLLRRLTTSSTGESATVADTMLARLDALEKDKRYTTVFRAPDDPAGAGATLASSSASSSSMALVAAVAAPTLHPWAIQPLREAANDVNTIAVALGGIHDSLRKTTAQNKGRTGGGADDVNSVLRDWLHEPIMAALRRAFFIVGVLVRGSATGTRARLAQDLQLGDEARLPRIHTPTQVSVITTTAAAADEGGSAIGGPDSIAAILLHPAVVLPLLVGGDAAVKTGVDFLLPELERDTCRKLDAFAVRYFKGISDLVPGDLAFREMATGLLDKAIGKLVRSTHFQPRRLGNASPEVLRHFCEDLQQLAVSLVAAEALEPFHRLVDGVRRSINPATRSLIAGFKVAEQWRAMLTTLQQQSVRDSDQAARSHAFAIVAMQQLRLAAEAAQTMRTRLSGHNSNNHNVSVSPGGSIVIYTVHQRQPSDGPPTATSAVLRASAAARWSDKREVITVRLLAAPHKEYVPLTQRSLQDAVLQANNVQAGRDLPLKMPTPSWRHGACASPHEDHLLTQPTGRVIYAAKALTAALLGCFTSYQEADAQDNRHKSRRLLVVLQGRWIQQILAHVPSVGTHRDAADADASLRVCRNLLHAVRHGVDPTGVAVSPFLVAEELLKSFCDLYQVNVKVFCALHDGVDVAPVLFGPPAHMGVGTSALLLPTYYIAAQSVLYPLPPVSDVILTFYPLLRVRRSGRENRRPQSAATLVSILSAVAAVAVAQPLRGTRRARATSSNADNMRTLEDNSSDGNPSDSGSSLSESEPEGEATATPLRRRRLASVSV